MASQMLRTVLFLLLVAAILPQTRVVQDMASNVVKRSLSITDRAPLLLNIKSRLPASFFYNSPVHSSQPHSTRNLTSTTTMASSTGFLDAVKARRTFYQISNESTISDDRIEEIVKHAVLHVPSSFNSQSSRLVVLLKKEHEKLWDITKEILRTQVPDEESFKNHTEPRINGFRAGYGTVLSRTRVAVAPQSLIITF